MSLILGTYIDLWSNRFEWSFGETGKKSKIERRRDGDLISSDRIAKYARYMFQDKVEAEPILNCSFSESLDRATVHGYRTRKLATWLRSWEAHTKMLNLDHEAPF